MFDYTPANSALRSRRLTEIIMELLMEEDRAKAIIDSIEKRVISLEKKIYILVNKLGSR